MTEPVTYFLRLKKVASYLWAALFFSTLIYMIFWKDISNSDIYQRNFNTAEWNVKQQERAERSVRHKELDQIECHIMLRAKAALVPVEIERQTLYGSKPESAEQRVIEEFELDKKMCEEYGITADSAKGKDRNDCERYPGPYGC